MIPCETNQKLSKPEFSSRLIQHCFPTLTALSDRYPSIYDHLPYGRSSTMLTFYKIVRRFKSNRPRIVFAKRWLIAVM